ncbi:MAG: hypothetical protein ACLQK4_06320 [Acidimicrobiales bacterium]
MAKVAKSAAHTIREAVPGPFALVVHVVALLAPVVPLATTVALQIRRGWRPTSDDAAIAWRSFDVFSSHAPLLGAFNDASVASAHPVFDLGPLQYYLLAVPDRIDPVHGILWGAALVAALFAALSVEAAWRAGGLLGGMVVSAGYVVLTATQTVVVLNLPWNPNFGLYAFSAAMVLSAVAASGRTEWWPVAVFAGCVAVECHLIFGAPAAAAVAVSVVLGLLARRRENHSLRPWVISLVTGAATGLLCLLAPLVEQLADHPGNLTVLFRNLSHQGPSLGLPTGLRALWRSAGVWPAWTHPVPSIGTGARYERFMSALFAGSTASGVVLLAVAFAIGAVALATRRSGLAGLAFVAAVSGAGLAWTIGAVAASQSAILTYADVALWPVGMALDLTIAWGVVELGRALARTWRREPSGEGHPIGLLPLLSVGAALVGLLAAGAWSLTSLVPELPHSDAVIGGWEVARAVGPIAAVIEHRQSHRHGPVIVEPSVHLLPSGLPTWALAEGVAYELKISGVDARLLVPMAPELGADAAAPRHATVYVVRPVRRGHWEVHTIAHPRPMVVF